MPHGTDYMMHAKTCPYLKDNSELAIQLIELLAIYTKTCADAKKNLDLAVENLFAPFGETKI
jgi:hypothetical protein